MVVAINQESSVYRSENYINKDICPKIVLAMIGSRHFLLV